MSVQYVCVLAIQLVRDSQFLCTRAREKVFFQNLVAFFGEVIELLLKMLYRNLSMKNQKKTKFCGQWPQGWSADEDFRT